MSTASLTSGNSDGDREAFSAFITDDSTIKALSPIVAEYGWSTDRIQGGGIANAVRSLSVMTSPEFLVVDLSDSDDPRGDINALAEVCEPGTVVLAVGTQNDVSLYRDLINSGIQDYLLKPLTVDMVKDAINTAQAALLEPAATADPGGPESHKVIAVIGVRGGVGASTLATSTGWLIGNELNRDVAILDLDVHFGTTALTFDLEPGRGLCDALENPGRVDGLFIERAMIKESEHLSILGAEAPMAEPMNPDPAALSHLVEELTQTFEIVIIDAPRNIVTAHPHLLNDVTDIIVVSDLSLAATRDTIRMMAFVAENAPAANCLLIVDQVAVGMNNEVTLKDFETSVERKADWAVPLDIKSALIAAKKGKSLPQAVPSSKIVRSFKEIAERITGISAAAEKKQPVWAKLVAGKGKE